MFLPPFALNGQHHLVTTFKTKNIAEYHYFSLPANDCGYIQRFKCFVIELIPTDEVGLQSLPDVPISGSSDANVTPYLEAPLQKGTLILYRYWINDF